MFKKITKKEIKEHGLKKDKKRTFTFTIPERYLTSDIIVMAGDVPFAIKPHWSDELSVKIGWCNNCGECCMLDSETADEWELGSKMMEFNGELVCFCLYVYKTKRPDGSDRILCNAGPIKPLLCIIHTQALRSLRFPSCSLDYDIKYEFI